MPAVYTELVEFIAKGPSRKEVANFQASDSAKAHVADLIRREKSQGITQDEKEELEHYLRIEHLMRLAKARARTGARIKCPFRTFQRNYDAWWSNGPTCSASIV